MTTVDIGSGGWRALLGPGRRGTMVALCGGVVVYATNIFLTAAVLPSAVAEMGGARLYAWVTTVFLVASVLSAVTVSRVLAALGARLGYLVAIGGFVAGTIGCAAAPTMEMLLVGRAVQGAGGGLLAGLVYALVQAVLPANLWTRASALVSGMWGVGTFAGPALGGVFAQLDAWRLAFVALAAGGGAVAVVAARHLDGTRPAARTTDVPVLAMVLLACAALLVSVASVAPGVGWTGAALVAAGGLIVMFVRSERRAGGRVLPAATFTPGTLKWTYLTIAVLAALSTADAFVPLFGQRLGGLEPLAAGFLGAVLAVGWTVGELSSAAATRARVVRAVLVSGSCAVVAGFAVLTGSQRADATVAPWILGLLLVGAGIGVSWPHLCASAMGASTDPVQAQRAAAAINTVQLVSNAVGSALAGVLVNLGDSTTGSARLLYGACAVVAVGAVVTAARAAPR